MVDGVTVEIIAQIQQHQAEAGEHFTITIFNTYQPHLNWWGLYSPFTPKTMNSFREKALWENNQRLLCQKEILKEKLTEVKQIRKNIAELEAMRTAIKEVK